VMGAAAAAATAATAATAPRQASCMLFPSQGWRAETAPLASLTRRHPPRPSAAIRSAQRATAAHTIRALNAISAPLAEGLLAAQAEVHRCEGPWGHVEPPGITGRGDRQRGTCHPVPLGMLGCPSVWCHDAATNSRAMTIVRHGMRVLTVLPPVHALPVSLVFATS
jgi:hypothetical protein